MERRDVASEEEEEYDSAEEEGSFSPSEDEAEGVDAGAISTTEGGADSPQAETDEAEGAHQAQGEKCCCSCHPCSSQLNSATLNYHKNGSFRQLPGHRPAHLDVQLHSTGHPKPSQNPSWVAYVHAHDYLV